MKLLRTLFACALIATFTLLYSSPLLAAGHWERHCNNGFCTWSYVEDVPVQAVVSPVAVAPAANVQYGYVIPASQLPTFEIKTPTAHVAQEFHVGDRVHHDANTDGAFPTGTGTVVAVIPWNTGDGFSYQVRCDVTGRVLGVNFKASELVALKPVAAAAPAVGAALYESAPVVTVGCQACQACGNVGLGTQVAQNHPALANFKPVRNVIGGVLNFFRGGRRNKASVSVGYGGSNCGCNGACGVAGCTCGQ